jgi:hypothetical protein
VIKWLALLPNWKVKASNLGNEADAFMGSFSPFKEEWKKYLELSHVTSFFIY